MLAVLHPGAMGAAVATCLVECGHQVGWLRKGRSGATLQRAEQAGLTAFDDLGHLLANTDIVFSICPPHRALGVAQQLAGFRGIVVDANAISPMTSTLIGRTVAHGGARYVDGGIIGPPPVTAGTTRLYLAGDDGEVAGVFAGSVLEAVGLAGAPPAASALKMTYAAWTKTTAALLVSIRHTAIAFGVDDDLAAEWAISQPLLPAAWQRAQQQSVEKGWRWSYELEEVGRTFAAAGEPEGFGAAASQVFAASLTDNVRRDGAKPLSHKAAQFIQLFQPVYLFVTAHLIHTPPSTAHTSTNTLIPTPSAAHHLNP